MSVLIKFPKARPATKAITIITDTKADVVPFPIASAAAIKAVVAAMEQHKVQKPARAELRAALKVRSKHLKAIGVDEAAISQDALAFARAVRVQLLHRRRIAGAAEQIESKIEARIGQRAATGAPLQAMPKPTPPPPQLRVRFPSKISIHPHYRSDRFVGEIVNKLMTIPADDVPKHITDRLASARFFVGLLPVDAEALDRFIATLRARIHAAYWRAVFDQPSTTAGTPPHDR